MQHRQAVLLQTRKNLSAGFEQILRLRAEIEKSLTRRRPNKARQKPAVSIEGGLCGQTHLLTAGLDACCAVPGAPFAKGI